MRTRINARTLVLRYTRRVDFPTEVSVAIAGARTHIYRGNHGGQLVV